MALFTANIREVLEYIRCGCYSGDRSIGLSAQRNAQGFKFSWAYLLVFDSMILTYCPVLLRPNYAIRNPTVSSETRPPLSRFGFRGWLGSHNERGAAFEKHLSHGILFPKVSKDSAYYPASGKPNYRQFLPNWIQKPIATTLLAAILRGECEDVMSEA